MTTEKYIVDFPQPFILVGNADHKGISYAESINKYPTIVRFNNFTLEYPYCNYTGIRTDIWCIAYNSGIEKHGMLAITPYIKVHHGQMCTHKKLTENLGFSPLYAEKNWYHLSGHPKPTTLFMLAKCMEYLNIDYNVVYVDGLQTGHYWQRDWKHYHGHKNGQDELNYFLSKNKCIDIERLEKINGRID